MATLNPIRFSSKYDDDESDFLYYGFRYYNPSTGRWLSRDPIAERGGLNLYGFNRNDSVDLIDPTGLTYGTISKLIFQPFISLGHAGVHVRFRWTPPSDLTCCKCSKAVWVQDKSWILVKNFGIFTQDWAKDWDETDYQGNSDLWSCGKIPNNMDMWDDPEVYGLSWWVTLSMTFRAESKVKCIEGADKGKIYGGVLWGYDAFSLTQSPPPDAVAAQIFGIW
jgi:RHS repeat-associated protein